MSKKLWRESSRERVDRVSISGVLQLFYYLRIGLAALA